MSKTQKPLFSQPDAQKTGEIRKNFVCFSRTPPALPILAFSFALYLIPSLLPAVFHNLAGLVPMPRLERAEAYVLLTRHALESSLAIAFFGFLIAKSPRCPGKPGNSLLRLGTALGVLTVCGLLAAGIRELIVASGNRLHAGASSSPVSAALSLGELRGSWPGTLLLILDTALAAYKEELIYRAVPGTVLAFLLKRKPSSIQSQTDDAGIALNKLTPAEERKRKLILFFAIVVCSLPFALAHQGLGTIIASLILGTSFLLLVLRGWSRTVLALAHTVYNLVVLLLQL